MVHFYAAFRAGGSVTLPDLPIQYADFAVWQRQQTQQIAFSTHLTYWVQKLADAPPLLELPTDYPRPPRPSFRGDKMQLVLPDDVSQDLRELSLTSNTSLFVTLLAAFKLLLSRYSGQEDIVVHQERPVVDLEHQVLAVVMEEVAAHP